MTSHETYSLETGSLYIKHTARVHFLNPKGHIDIEQRPVVKPELEHILDNLPERTLGEVAWISFWMTPHASLQRGEDAIEAKFPPEVVGTTYLATGWNRGTYSFSSIDELLEADMLPIYTAEWLARRVARESPNYNTDPIWKRLVDKPPFNEAENPSENPDLRAKRLVKQLLDEHPHLGPRFVTRDIIDKSDIEDGAPEPAQPTYTITFDHNELLKSTLDSLNYMSRYRDPVTGEQVSPPQKKTDDAGNTKIILGTWLMRSEWKINGIVAVRTNDKIIEVDVCEDTDENEIIHQIEQAQDTLLQSRERTKKALSSLSTPESTKFKRQQRAR